MTSALVLIGAPGAGKSAVLDALATQLELADVEHGAIESEELSRGSPPLPGEAWIEQLALALAAQRRAGRGLFLIAATTETEQELGGVLAAAAADRSLVVCLTAPSELLAKRLQRREPDRWPGKPGLIAHARGLASVVPALAGIDLSIGTDGREADDVAAEVLAEMRTRGLIEAHAGRRSGSARRLA